MGRSKVHAHDTQTVRKGSAAVLLGGANVLAALLAKLERRREAATSRIKKGKGCGHGVFTVHHVWPQNCDHCVHSNKLLR